MAILHAATLTPTKAEIITRWLTAQSWAPTSDEMVDLIGSYRLDDPEGEVGMEAHLVRSAGELLHVPLTYRSGPLSGADDHLLGNTEHSVLGERWVYDGLGDPVFTRMLAAAAMTGCGQAISMVERGGRWVLLPTQVRLSGGGWNDERVALDGFAPEADEANWAVLRNDRFELRVARRPEPGGQPPIGLTGTWPGQNEPVILAEVRERTTGRLPA